MLIFESPEFETVKHRITSKEDIEVQVKDYSPSFNSAKKRSRSNSFFTVYLDSAEYYRKIDIKKSIDFVTQSISALGTNPNKAALAWMV